MERVVAMIPGSCGLGQFDHWSSCIMYSNNYEEGESEEREEKEGEHLIPSGNAKALPPQLARAAPSIFSGPR